MEEKRRQEIALAMVENRLAKSGIPGSRRLNAEMKILSDETGVKAEELMDFYRSCIPRILGESFGFPRVAVTMTNARGSETIDITNSEK